MVVTNIKKMEEKEKDFTQLVREHKSTIYTVCYMFSKDEDEVNDLFQESLIRLWKGYDKFRGECSVNTWVYRVSLNTCISMERKKKKSNKQVRLDMNINLFEDDDKDTRQIRQLYDRIHCLGPIDRAIVLMWLDNMSYDEIAAIIGITVSNVSAKLHRIKLKLMSMK